MLPLSGLGKTNRKQLAAVIRGTKGTVSVGEAASILGVSRVAAAKMLAHWASKGWLSRVRRGLYVAVPPGVPNGGYCAGRSLADRGPTVCPLLHRRLECGRALGPHGADIPHHRGHDHSETPGPLTSYQGHELPAAHGAGNGDVWTETGMARAGQGISIRS